MSFITRIAHYLKIDIEETKLMMIAPSTIPTNLTVIRNMGMVVCDLEGKYILHMEHTAESSAPASGSPPPPRVPLFILRIVFEYYAVQQHTKLRTLLRQHTTDTMQQLTNVNNRLTFVESTLERSQREIHDIYQFYSISASFSIDDIRDTLFQPGIFPPTSDPGLQFSLSL